MNEFEQDHNIEIQKQFAMQAKRFDQEGYPLSNTEYLKWAIDNIPLNKDYLALDNASGTGILARALARYVKTVHAIDASRPMLQSGKEAARREGINNIIFNEGFAQSLPYDDSFFDLTTCRLALHHFYDVYKPLQEMVRVTKTSGYIAIMDLVSPDDRQISTFYNRLENLRDSSHTYALTEQEMLELFRRYGIDIIKAQTRDVEMVLDDWLDLTDAPKDSRAAITESLLQELDGGKKTGMRPYIKDNKIYFLHTWMLIVGQKV
ncbi:MAG: methyltransferase domain-containing protein [Clostridiales bacterium]|nr:methyltransferase domain-containing protein [Clostridiales bacterium]